VGGTLARVTLPAPMTGNVYDAANQLVSRGGVALSYDANGNLVSDGTRQYQWNARGQLVNISVGGVTVGEFRYDALGRRSFKRVRGVATRFLYDGQNYIQELSEGTSPTVKAWVQAGTGNDTRFSRTGQQGTLEYLTDAAGSTVGMVNSNGDMAASYSYEPYGAGTRTGDDEGNAQTYIGREDDGLGLLYVRARYYDPTLGRFLQPEPLLMDPTAALFNAMNGQSLPTYAYALNNPMSYKDADGRMAAIAAPAVFGPPGWAVAGAMALGFGIYWCMTHDCIPHWPTPADPPRPFDPPQVCPLPQSIPIAPPITMARPRSGSCKCKIRVEYESGGASCEQLFKQGVCPKFYFGSGADKAACQDNARTNAPAGCAGCLGHCHFTPD
jgi:RHS repeat-associated protein